MTLFLKAMQTYIRNRKLAVQFYKRTEGPDGYIGLSEYDPADMKWFVQLPKSVTRGVTTLNPAEIWVRLEATEWGIRSGNDETRHNFDMWVKRHKPERLWGNWCFVTVEFIKTIFVRVSGMNVQMYEDVLTLISKELLEPELLSETQNAIKRKMWIDEIQDDWEETLLQGAAQAFWNLATDDFDKNITQLRRLIKDEKKLEWFFWELTRRYESKHRESVWAYSSGDSAYIYKDLEHIVADVINYRDLFPINPNDSKHLPFEAPCEYCDCLHIHDYCNCTYRIGSVCVPIDHEYKPTTKGKPVNGKSSRNRKTLAKAFRGQETW